MSVFYPWLTYDDAPAAIEFLCKAFGFRRRLVVPGENGAVRHSELTLGDGVVMVGSSDVAKQRTSPRNLAALHGGICVLIDDPDAHHARAAAAGAEITQPPQDEHYGGRGYMARDPEGHLWYFGTYVPGAHWTE